MTMVQSFDVREMQSPVLNLELLERFRGRKSNLLERLITAFFQEAPMFFQNINSAHETNALSDVRLNSHALKSCSYNLGAVRLSKLCQEIETAVVEENRPALDAAMQRLGFEWFEADQALRGEFFKLTGNAIPPAKPQAAKPAAEQADWY